MPWVSRRHCPAPHRSAAQWFVQALETAGDQRALVEAIATGEANTLKRLLGQKAIDPALMGPIIMLAGLGGTRNIWECLLEEGYSTQVVLSVSGTQTVAGALCDSAAFARLKDLMAWGALTPRQVISSCLTHPDGDRFEFGLQTWKQLGKRTMPAAGMAICDASERGGDDNIRRRAFALSQAWLQTQQARKPHDLWRYWWSQAPTIPEQAPRWIRPALRMLIVQQPATTISIDLDSQSGRLWVASLVDCGILAPEHFVVERILNELEQAEHPDIGHDLLWEAVCSKWVSEKKRTPLFRKSWHFLALKLSRNGVRRTISELRMNIARQRNSPLPTQI